LAVSAEIIIRYSEVLSMGVFLREALSPMAIVSGVFVSHVQAHQPNFKDTRRISRVTVRSDINFRNSYVFSLGSFLHEVLSPITIVSRGFLLLVGLASSSKEPAL
jgi:hypothetical protein